MVPEVTLPGTTSSLAASLNARFSQPSSGLSKTNTAPFCSMIGALTTSVWPSAEICTDWPKRGL